MAPECQLLPNTHRRLCDFVSAFALCENEHRIPDAHMFETPWSIPSTVHAVPAYRAMAFGSIPLLIPLLLPRQLRMPLMSNLACPQADCVGPGLALAPSKLLDWPCMLLGRVKHVYKRAMSRLSSDSAALSWGEQQAAAIEANLASLESKLDALLASIEATDPADVNGNTDADTQRDQPPKEKEK
ncbi:hypothetical protein F4859DRAFT_511391 [Xylaria cf. heliscus]|nr:hypothetical protein F4859DRAFT_511391 [Xylaria cf. heliscus]